jgi:uncharacterized protein (DUF849 family)
MVAPNGATRTPADHPALPVTIPQIVATARACFDAGAGGIHAHVRDAAGRHVLDAGLYAELLWELARAVPGMVAQITTEAQGIYSPAAQRAVVAGVPAARSVSVALREMLAEDDPAAARGFYHDCAERGVAVQHILYDGADIDRLAAARAGGIVPGGPVQVLLVLGRYVDGQRAVPADLAAPHARLMAHMPEADWAVCAFGAAETGCLVAAAALGGKMRVGFENNLTQADGTAARDNADRVRDLRAALAQDAARRAKKAAGRVSGEFAE